MACLRTGHERCDSRARTRRRGKKFVTPQIMISQRPAEADDRRAPGHWEGDLILGLHSSAIGTLVERSTRFTMLLHLPPMPGHRKQQRIKNGPALAGHGAQAVRDAIVESITTLPQQFRRSLTWDQGAEMGPTRPTPRRHRPRHLLLRTPSTMAARRQREHQRSLTPILPQRNQSQQTLRNDLDAVATTLNSRPRKSSAGRPLPRPSTNT